MMDNLILNQLANRKPAPYWPIKKREENKGIKLNQSLFQSHSDHSIHYISGQTLKHGPTPKPNHSLTTHFRIQQREKIKTLTI